MSSNVLVPIDGSDQSYGGLLYAFESFPDAEFTTLHVVDIEREWYEGPGFPEKWEDRAREAAAAVHERAEELAAEHDREIDTETEIGIPHKRILGYVVDHEIDHVVMGSHGESPITRPFVGHVAEAVTRRAPVSVSVVPLSTTAVRSRNFPGKILVPVDGSPRAETALTYVLEGFPEASITALHVVNGQIDYAHEELRGTYVEALIENLEKRAEDVLESAEEQAAAHGREIDTETASGKPRQVIVDHAADEGFDQIVMGSHGRSGVARVLLGSVAETVVRRSSLPVTVVRPLGDE